MKNQKQAYIFASVAMLFWATIGAAFKLTLRYLDYIHLLFFSTFVACLFLFFIMLFQKKLTTLKSLSKKDYLNSAFLGFLNPFLYYMILLKAYSIIQAQEAVVLNYLWPVVLVLLSIPLLKQTIPVKSIIALLISFIGIYVIATQGDVLGFKFTNSFGVLLAIVSTVIWALYWIYNLKDKRDEVSKLFLNFLFGFFYLSLTILIFFDFNIPDIKGIAGVVYVGLFEMGITFVVWLKALKLSTTTAKVTNLIFLAPFLSLIVIHFTVGEKIMVSTFVGLIFIIGGIVLQKLIK